MMLTNGVKKIVIFPLAVLLIFLIGIIDTLTGLIPDITILYLIPIISTTILLGPKLGMATTIVALATETYSNILIGINFTPNLVLDSLTHLLIFILSVILVNRLQVQIRQTAELEQKRSYDLAIAREVHGYIFKPFTGKIPGLDIETKVAFAGELGGDYIYFAEIGKKLFLCIGDISGKSVAAALYSALLHQNIILALDKYADLTSIAESVNAQIFEATPENMFITLFFAFIDNDAVSYINAGHEPPLLYTRKQDTVRSLTSRDNFPAGIKPSLKIEQATIPLSLGDTLLLFTDGVSDSEYFRDDPYIKLESELLYNRDADPRVIVDSIFEKTKSNDIQKLADDIIIACVKRVPGSP